MAIESITAPATNTTSFYEAEGTDAALGMVAWGYETDMRRWLVPLLDFTRKNLECHQAGFKLENLCRYFWQTRDAEAVRSLRPRWEKEARLLADNRTNDVSALSQGPVLRRYSHDGLQRDGECQRLARAARPGRGAGRNRRERGGTAICEMRPSSEKRWQTAIDKSIRRETTPPFVPVALYADEPPHTPITTGRIGSYWNVVIDYVAGSGIFPPGTPQETGFPLPGRARRLVHGKCSAPRSGGWFFGPAITRCGRFYTTRYALDTLRRDDPERALVNLYGALAQRVHSQHIYIRRRLRAAPVDDGGRFSTVRQTAPLIRTSFRRCATCWCRLGPGRRRQTGNIAPVLRHTQALAGRWQTVQLDRAPTAFGKVSVRMESKLKQGESLRNWICSAQSTKRTLLRCPGAGRWKVAGRDRMRGR